MIRLTALISLLSLVAAGLGETRFPNPTPITVGTYGDKTFFVGNRVCQGFGCEGWNWFEAGEYCQQNGLQLGTIETKEEANFLIESMTNEYAAWYWTSGRDAHASRQFSWNTTNSQVMDVLEFEYSSLSNNLYLTCLAFYVKPFENFGALAPLSCSTEILSRGVLCESILSV